MPTFKFHGPVFSFAAWKNHYALYPLSESLLRDFPKLLSLATSKGTVKFPYGEPIPVQLIQDMAKHRAAENLENATKQKTR